MSNATSLTELNHFTLENDGDRHEQERWKLVRDRFPKYEIFWQLYIVPLTNRTTMADQGASWIRLRPDVPAEWAKLAICHYSVFYYLSRAAQRRLEYSTSNHDNPIHPEDVIYLLQTCCENVTYFFDAVTALSVRAARYIPAQAIKDRVFCQISAYRNLLLHNPVLGRGESDGETLLPRLPDDHINSLVNKLKFSWSAIREFAPEDLVPARALLKGLEDDLAKYLNDQWEPLIRELSNEDMHSKFPRFFGPPLTQGTAQHTNRIATDSSCVNVAQAIAASGTFNIPSIVIKGK